MRRVPVSVTFRGGAEASNASAVSARTNESDGGRPLTRALPHHHSAWSRGVVSARLPARARVDGRHIDKFVVIHLAAPAQL